MSCWSRLLLLPALLTVGAGLGACGGEDLTRPEAERPIAEDPDYCAIAADEATEYRLLTSFDSMGGNSAARCGTDDPPFSCQFNFNYDTERSPADDTGRAKGDDCVQEIRPGSVVQTEPNVGSRIVPQSAERCGGEQSAYHFTGLNVAMCYGQSGRRGWGGSQELGFKFRDMSGNEWPAFDMSEWDGLAFWVKKGANPNAESAVILLVVDEFAAGQTQREDPETGEFVECGAGAPVAEPAPGIDSEKCDPFSMAVTLTPEWTFVKVRFEDLRQKGFGKRAPHGLDLSGIIRLQFLITAGDWDFWLDDISLFRDAE